MRSRRSLFDRKIIKNYTSIIAGLTGIISFIVLFLPWETFEPSIKYWLLGIIIFVCLIIYVINYFYVVNLRSIEINIEGTHLRVESGDIFAYGDEYLKVIGFNEYFDTHVGDGLIDPGTLNGIYLNKVANNIEQLDKNIEQDYELNFIENHRSRKLGKTKKYKLGSIHKDNNYLLIALTRFDECNNARVTLSDLTDCFLNMWNEIDRLKGTKKIVLPLLASGQTTRIGSKGAQLDVTDQEILELIISTLKISRIKIKKPADITIVLYGDKVKNIDLFKIKEMY